MTSALWSNPHGPLSSREILRRAGCGASGQSRKLFNQDLDSALRKLYQNAVASSGEEMAAAILTHILAKDPDYPKAPWMLEAIIPHRKFISEQFAREPPDEPENPVNQGRKGRTRDE